MAASRVDYDDILKHIGQFGTWQKRIHFWLWLVSAASGLCVVVYSFTAYSMDHRCKNPYCDVDDISTYFPNASFIQASIVQDQSCAYFGFQNEGLIHPTIEDANGVANQDSCDKYLAALEDQTVDKKVVICQP